MGFERMRVVVVVVVRVLRECEYCACSAGACELERVICEWGEFVAGLGQRQSIAMELVGSDVQQCDFRSDCIVSLLRGWSLFIA